MDLIAGLITGVLFGAFLQQGEVLRFERHIGALRLRDMTIVKFMFSTILVGTIGVHILLDAGIAEFSPRDFNLAAQLIGGVLFGVSWAFLGYCPGTSIGAVAEGRRHVWWPIFGMLVGGLIFALLYGFIDEVIMPVGAFGSVSIPEAVGLNHWIIIAVFTAAVLLLFRFFERKGL